MNLRNPSKSHQPIIAQVFHLNLGDIPPQFGVMAQEREIPIQFYGGGAAFGSHEWPLIPGQVKPFWCELKASVEEFPLASGTSLFACNRSELLEPSLDLRTFARVEEFPLERGQAFATHEWPLIPSQVVPFWTETRAIVEPFPLERGLALLGGVYFTSTVILPSPPGSRLLARVEEFPLSVGSGIGSHEWPLNEHIRPPERLLAHVEEFALERGSILFACNHTPDVEPSRVTATWARAEELPLERGSATYSHEWPLNSFIVPPARLLARVEERPLDAGAALSHVIVVAPPVAPSSPQHYPIISREEMPLEHGWSIIATVYGFGIPAQLFEQALAAKLNAVTALTAIVGSAIYVGHIPETHQLDASGPALTYMVPGKPRGHVLMGSDGTATARVQLDAWSYGYGISKQILEAIRQSIDGIPVNPWGNGTCIIVSVVQQTDIDQSEPPADGSDKWIYHLISEYQIKYRVSLPTLN